MKRVHVKTYYRVGIPTIDHMYICLRPIIDHHHCLSPRNHSDITYDIPPYTKCYLNAKNIKFACVV